MNFNTVGELVKYILENRKGKAFEGHTHEQLVIEILRASFNHVFLCNIDSEGIHGVVTGSKDDKAKTVTINNILTTKKGVVKEFMKLFMKHYPDYIIVGKVRNRDRQFLNPAKLTNRLH